MNRSTYQNTYLIARADVRLCRASVASKNPTNLKDHLKVHHSTRYNEIVAKESEQTEAKVKRVQEGEEHIQPIYVV
jgi:hypothetical protein